MPKLVLTLEFGGEDMSTMGQAAQAIKKAFSGGFGGRYGEPRPPRLGESGTVRAIRKPYRIVGTWEVTGTEVEAASACQSCKDLGHPCFEHDPLCKR